MSVAFAPDGKRLAIASAEGVTVVTPLSRQATTLGELVSSHCAVFSQDGTMIASAHIDGCVRIWDVQESSMLTEIQGLDSLAVQLQFSPDGKLLATGGTTIELWNVEDGKRVNNYHGQVSMAFSPDGQTLASGRFDSTVRFQAVEPIENRSPNSRVSTVPSAIAVSPDGALAAAGYMTGGIRIWDAYSGEVVAHKWDVAPMNVMAFDPDGQFLATLSSVGSVTLRDPLTGTQIRRLERPRATQNVISFAFLPDGKKLVVADQAGRISLYDLKTDQIDRLFDAPSGPMTNLTLAPDGKTIAAAIGQDSITVWDVDSRRIAHVLHVEGAIIDNPAFSHDGRLLAATSSTGNILLWDLSTSDAPQQLECHVGQVPRLKFSPDGKMLLSAGFDGKIVLWDAQTLDRRAVLKGGRGAVLALAIAPDSQFFLSGGFGLPVRFWRAPALDEPGQLDADLRLEQQVLAVWKAEPDQMEKRCTEFGSAFIETASQGLDQRKRAALRSVARALQTRKFPGSHALLMDLANKVGESGQSSLRDEADRFRAAAWCERGGEHVEAQQWEEALASFTKAIAIDPENWQLHRDRGNVCIELGNAVQAVREFDTARELNPTMWELHAERAKALANMFEWSRAADDLSVVVQHAPTNSQLWVGLGALHVLAGDQDAYQRTCRRAYQRFSDAEPDDQANLVYLCSLQPDCGIERKQLTMIADALIELDDTKSTFRLAKGADCYRNGQLEEAAKILEKGGDVWSGPLLAFFEAMCHQRLGDTRSAKRRVFAGRNNWARRGIDIKAGWLVNYAPDGWICWCFGEVLRREAQTMMLGQGSEHLGEIRNLVAAGKLTDAMHALDMAIEKQPDDEGLLSERASRHICSLDWEKAAADYSRAAEINPDGYWAYHGPTLILAGNSEEYRRRSQERFEDLRSGDPTPWQISCCMLLPDSVDISKVPKELYEVELDVNNVAWDFSRRVLISYRIGDLEKAQRWANMLIKSEYFKYNPHRKSQTLSIMAMCHQQKGELDQAQNMLQQASEILDENLPKLTSDQLQVDDWLVADVLCREAKELIGSD